MLEVLTHSTRKLRSALAAGRLESRSPDYGADVSGVYMHLMDPGYMAARGVIHSAASLKRGAVLCFAAGDLLRDLPFRACGQADGGCEQAECILRGQGAFHAGLDVDAGSTT